MGYCDRRQLMHQLRCWTIRQRLRQVKLEDLTGFVLDIYLARDQSLRSCMLIEPGCVSQMLSLSQVCLSNLYLHLNHTAFRYCFVVDGLF